MRRRSFLLILALSALAGGTGPPAAAQMMVPVGVDLFGDAIVRPLPKPGIAPSPGDEPIPAGYAHLLQFHDGRELHGTLVELNKDRIVWSRPDAEPAIEIPRNEVRRVFFSAKKAGLPMANESLPKLKAPTGAAKDVMTTVKLPGGDWLFGDARTENGEEISITLDNEVPLKFSSAAVEWMYFGRQPAPAFGLSGEALEVEGWTLGKTGAPVEVVDGLLNLGGAGWIGRDISAPDRFVVDFEVPNDGNTTRLLLQPMRPSPNSYSTGTVELLFGKKELSGVIFINNFNRKAVAMPEDKEASARVRYRVFYDAPGNRVMVMRKDATVVEWKLREEEDANNGRGGVRMTRQIRGICFDRGQGGAALVLARARMQPWDGLPPEPGDAKEARMSAAGAKRTGKLESISETEIGFGGEKAARAEGTFITFPQTPAALSGGNALVSFGRAGELAVADFEVREGRVRGRSAAIAELNLPAEAVHSVVFPNRSPQGAADADTLVFRNGNSMGGNLFSAGGASVRWQSRNGQELTFKPEHIAGIRLGGSQPRDTAVGSTVELLNGDRLRGELVSLNASELRLRHDGFGERAVSRALLRAVYPSKKTLIMDAGSDPEMWLGLARRGKLDLFNAGRPKENSYGPVFLDGFFFSPPGQGSGSSATMLRGVFDKLDRYELRCEVTDAGGREPYINATLAGNNGTPSLQLTVGHGQLRIYSYDMPGGGGRAFQQQREVSLAGKEAAPQSRRELRMFIDKREGTADFMVGGAHIMRFGQQKGERAPGIGARVTLSAYNLSGNIGVLSNVWVGPWNGDVPRAGELAQGASLNNGDMAPGAIGDLKNDQIAVGDGPDAIEVPIDRISSLVFSSTPSTEKPVARVRLTDGTVLNLQEFEWAQGTLRGKSGALGPVEIGAKAITELILAPAPARFPHSPGPSKLAKKDGEGAPEAKP